MVHFREGLLPVLLCLLLLSGAPVLAQETETAEGTDQPALQQEVLVPESPGPRTPSGMSELPPRDVFAGILERPLFNEDRKPVVETSDNQALVSAAELREQWKLTGIVMVGNEVRAMLQQLKEDRQLTLTQGMPLDSTWMLETINVDSVIMDSGDEQVRLELMTPRDIEPALEAEQASESSEQGNSDEQNRQPDARAAEPRRLRQSTEVSDE